MKCCSLTLEKGCFVKRIYNCKEIDMQTSKGGKTNYGNFGFIDKNIVKL